MENFLFPPNWIYLLYLKSNERFRWNGNTIFYCSHMSSTFGYRTEIVKKIIDDFNNSVHLSMKASKKVVEIFRVGALISIY